MINKNITTIIFDYDGCLCDTLDLWMKTYIETYKNYSFNVTKEEVLKLSWGNNELGPQNIGIENYIECFNEIRKRVAEGVVELPLNSGALYLLNNLYENNYKLGLVSSSTLPIIETGLKKQKIYQYFSSVVTAEKVANLKPHPEPILKCLEELESGPKETVSIGDSSSDIKAGKEAGVMKIVYRNESNSFYHDLRKLKALEPDFFVSSFDEFGNLLNKLNRT